MASRSVARSVLRVQVTLAALTGLLAGMSPRLAYAQSTPAPGNSESLDEAPTAVRDEYPPPSARAKLLIGGLATTAGWYGLALGSSLVWPDAVGANDLKIPVAGPWMALSHSGCGNVSDCSVAIVVLRAIATAVDGIGQAGGLAIAAEGLFLPTREPKPKRAELEHRGFQMHPTFDAGKNSVGFGVLGVF